MSNYYAENIARHLAKTTLQKFVEAWASKREPDKKANKPVAARFMLFDMAVVVEADKDGEKRLNGHLVKEFWKHLDEATAKRILCEKPYLVKGLCTWADLWQALQKH